MTTLDTNRSTALKGSFAPRASNFAANIVATLAAWNDARITRKALSRLSARELDDIGLTRNDIDMIATRGGRF